VQVKLDHETLQIGVKICEHKTIFELPPPSDDMNPSLDEKSFMLPGSWFFSKNLEMILRISWWLSQGNNHSLLPNSSLAAPENQGIVLWHNVFSLLFSQHISVLKMISWVHCRYQGRF